MRFKWYSLDKEPHSRELKVKRQRAKGCKVRGQICSLTKVVLPIRLGKILNINLIESLEGKLQQHRYEIWMVRYSPNTAGRVDYWNTPMETLRMEMPRWM